jgi:hypothetical protein
MARGETCGHGWPWKSGLPFSTCNTRVQTGSGNQTVPSNQNVLASDLSISRVIPQHASLKLGLPFSVCSNRTIVYIFDALSKVIGSRENGYADKTLTRIPRGFLGFAGNQSYLSEFAAQDIATG